MMFVALGRAQSVILVDVRPQVDLLWQVRAEANDERKLAELAKRRDLTVVSDGEGIVLISSEALGRENLAAKQKVVEALVKAMRPGSAIVRSEDLPLEEREMVRAALLYAGPLKDQVRQDRFRFAIVPVPTVRLKSGDKTIEVQPFYAESKADQAELLVTSGSPSGTQPSENAFEALFRSPSFGGLWVGSTATEPERKLRDYQRALTVWGNAYAKTMSAMLKLKDQLLSTAVGLLGSSGSFKLSELPASVAGGIRGYVEGSWAAYGFPDAESAKKFLQGATGDIVRSSFAFRGRKVGPNGQMSVGEVEFSLRP